MGGCLQRRVRRVPNTPDRHREKDGQTENRCPQQASHSSVAPLSPVPARRFYFRQPEGRPADLTGSGMAHHPRRCTRSRSHRAYFLPLSQKNMGIPCLDKRQSIPGSYYEHLQSQRFQDHPALPRRGAG